MDHASKPITKFTPQEALACSMVLMAVCDGAMTDAELNMLSRLATELPCFKGLGGSEIEAVTEVCLRQLARADGLDTLTGMICDALPPRLRETAYLLACEAAAADGDVSQDELRFLQDFRIALDIDRLIAGAIERASRARYQVI
ncbi:tellurite resistance TerB family protein [Acetobacteraceae bacterium H6797]|nr:tellurite resistance TerB family protein [Acetobacteraceae bacterium H6797]